MGMPQRDADVVVLNQPAGADGIRGAVTGTAENAAAPERSVSEPVVPPGAEAEAAAIRETIGEKLAAARKLRLLTLEDVSDGTKIKIAVLAAIEAGESAALPAVPFTAGFVKAYAQFLGLDPDVYSAAWRAEAAPSTQEPQVAPVPSVSRSVGPQTLIAHLGAGAAIFCVLWIGLKVLGPKRPPAIPGAPVEIAAVQPTGSWSRAVTDSHAMAAAIETSEADAAPANAADPVSELQAALGAPPAGPVAAELAETPARTLEPAPAPAAKTAAKPPAAKTAAKPPVAKTAAKPRAPAVIPPTTPTAETPPAAEGETETEEVRVAAAIRPTPSPPKPAAHKERRAEPAAIAPPVETAPEPVLPPRVTTISPPAPSIKARPAIVEARLIRTAEPKYPQRCVTRAEPVENVNVAFDVGADGRPVNARIVDSSNGCFNSAAIAAANRMRFSPRTEDGAPAIESGKRATIQFVE